MPPLNPSVVNTLAGGMPYPWIWSIRPLPPWILPQKESTNGLCSAVLGGHFLGVARGLVWGCAGWWGLL